MNLFSPSSFLSHSSPKCMTVNHIFISPYEDKPITFCPRLSLISSVFSSPVSFPPSPSSLLRGRDPLQATRCAGIPLLNSWSLLWRTHTHTCTPTHTNKPVLAHTHTDVTLCPSESQLQMCWPSSLLYALMSFAQKSSSDLSSFSFLLFVAPH